MKTDREELEALLYQTRLRIEENQKEEMLSRLNKDLEFIEDLEKWWRQYTGMAISKRIQAPPILAISRRAFGFGNRESQNRVYYTSKYLFLKNQLVN